MVAYRLAEPIEALDLREVILVGHSTGGAEVTRYLGRHGTARVARAVLLGTRGGRRPPDRGPPSFPGPVDTTAVGSHLMFSKF